MDRRVKKEIPGDGGSEGFGGDIEVNRRTEEQKNRGTEEQKNRRTEEQRNRGTEEQKNRGTRNRGTEE